MGPGISCWRHRPEFKRFRQGRCCLERSEPAAYVESAIVSRRSVRAFLRQPVPREIVERILNVAARAPSGTNMQPWRVYVLTDGPKDRLSRAVLDAFESDEPGHTEYRYYPAQFFEPYLSRRRKVGFDLYGLLGIRRGEAARMKAQTARNFRFFDAPIGMIFTIDRRLEIGSWLDHGMFLQNVMVAARGWGLDTCPQASFTPYQQVIRRELGLAPEEVVVCGMSLGYADPAAPENRLVTEREPASAFATFRGF
ncbi:MAG: nitroreductase [Acetobacteraceae bacterium]|nr:nitroreductase [Acetobacteraceae bacterium]